jgi:hypothetical protein
VERLWVESRFRDEIGRGLPPALLRKPIVMLEPLPCAWRGESEEPHPLSVTGYALVRDPSAAWPGDRTWMRVEYPVFCTVSAYGMNMFEGDAVLALADDFEAISKDERLGCDTRFALAARLMRRFASRTSGVNLPGE